MTYIKSVIKYPYYLLTYVTGLISFWLTGKTPHSGYVALRYYYLKSNGRINNFLWRISRILHPEYKNLQPRGVLGTLSRNDIRKIVKNIEKEGFYVFDNKLDDLEINKLINFASSTPANYIDAQSILPAFKDGMAIVDESNIVSPRYQFMQKDLVQNHTILRLATDTSITAIAQAYLKCKPVLDKITMWWSFPFNDLGKSAAAQMYHFDMDRIKWLKFFIYLTDVDGENGPHCFIRGSHRNKPKSLRSNPRKTDEEMSAHYKAEDMLEICGQKGTVMAVDTIGFHKGKALTNGKRLIFQLEFANSLFGNTYHKAAIANDAPKDVVQNIMEYRHTFNQTLKIP